jgi:hypothetical protein
LADDPTAAREALAEALTRWHTAAPDALQFGVGEALALVESYEAEGITAAPLARLRELSRRFAPTGFFRMASFRASYRLSLGRALVAAAHATPAGPERATLLVEARTVTEALRREANVALNGHTSLIEAGISSLSPESTAADVASFLAAAIEALEPHGLADIGAAARLRLARLLPASDAVELAEEGRAFFVRQGFEQVERIVAALVPGSYLTLTSSLPGDHGRM